MAIEHSVKDAGPLLWSMALMYFVVRVISEGDLTSSLISLAKAFEVWIFKFFISVLLIPFKTTFLVCGPQLKSEFGVTSLFVT